MTSRRSWLYWAEHKNVSWLNVFIKVFTFTVISLKTLFTQKRTLWLIDCVFTWLKASKKGRIQRCVKNWKRISLGSLDHRNISQEMMRSQKEIMTERPTERLADTVDHRKVKLSIGWLYYLHISINKCVHFVLVYVIILWFHKAICMAYK